MFHVNLLKIENSQQLVDRIEVLKKTRIDFLKQEIPRDYIIKSFLGLSIEDKQYEIIAAVICNQAEYETCEIFYNSSTTEEFYYDFFDNEIVAETLNNMKNAKMEDMDELNEYMGYEVENFFGLASFNPVTQCNIFNYDEDVFYEDNFRHADTYSFTEFGVYKNKILYEYLLTDKKLFVEVIESILRGED